jgi:TolB protein
VWSPDASTLAWGQVTEEGFAVGIQTPGSGDPTTVSTTNLPFYTFWSPDGENLGVLHNGTSGVEFRMVDVATGTSESLDEDAPFYFSWSPESDRVVTHAGRDRAETITPTGEREALEPTEGGYLSPQWGPNGVFHVADDHLIIEVDGERRPIVAVTGSTFFVSNPQGTLLALQATGDGSDISASIEDLPTVTTEAVVVVDVETGDAEVVSNGLALGFFWSPDGESLLVLTTSDSGVVPRVWNADGEAMVFDSYFPPRSMLEDTFPFFPQYAQSVSFWAPNSSAFAYAGAVGDEQGIWIQDLDAHTATKVSDGSWVAWSAASS